MNEDDIELGSCSPELITLLDSNDIQPGAQAGYETCKTIYLYHPLGGKMVDRPIKMAMNESRTVHVAQSYGLSSACAMLSSENGKISALTDISPTRPV